MATTDVTTGCRLLYILTVVGRNCRKAIGSKVVARLRGGRKTVAELVGADDDTVTLRYPEKDVTETIPLAQVNTIAYYI